MDLADTWIDTMHLKTDTKTCVIYKYDSGAYVPAEKELAPMIDTKFRGLNTTSFISRFWITLGGSLSTNSLTGGTLLRTVYTILRPVRYQIIPLV